jgi:hypothetical protein
MPDRRGTSSRPAPSTPPGGPAGELPPPLESLDVGPEAEQARERISTFLDAAREVVEPSGPGGAYVPEALALRATPAVDGAQPGPVEPEVRPWPLPSVDLSAAGECLLVSGADAAALLPVLREANALTRFEQSGTRYALAVRPLLPGPAGC